MLGCGTPKGPGCSGGDPSRRRRGQAGLPGHSPGPPGLVGHYPRTNKKTPGNKKACLGGFRPPDPPLRLQPRKPVPPARGWVGGSWGLEGGSPPRKFFVGHRVLVLVRALGGQRWGSSGGGRCSSGPPFQNEPKHFFQNGTHLPDQKTVFIQYLGASKEIKGH